MIISVALAAALTGLLAALHYAHANLTLSHYDARGHLVVARRIFDSLTPGWQQIGAVWLPLPHLLNAVPVQVDAWYRTGASAVAISIASFAMAAASIAWIVRRLTGSAPAAVVASAVFVANPNVLYLQSTPMTEPLLLGLTTLGVAMLMAWCDGIAGRFERPAPQTRECRSEGPRRSGGRNGAAKAGVVLALACLTRYEAWPVTVVALGAAAWTLWRHGVPIAAAVRAVARVAAWPAAAVAAFLVFSRATVGAWFVDSGFFVPENKALGKPIEAAAEVWWGVHGLSGNLVMALAAAGVVALAVAGLTRRRRAAALIALSLGATAALPWAAFVKGHPFRVRYMVPLIAIEAVAAGVVVGWLLSRIAGGRSARARSIVAVVSVAAVVAIAIDLQPLNASAPMVIEAQWDRPNVPQRARVTGCLRAGYGGETIMASMGSLGHYMQETSRAGFRISDFLHEGNGDLWLAAVEEPQPYVGWILIEEKAEGGDMLAARAREDPQFLRGFTRVCEGAGVALYRRDAR